MRYTYRVTCGLRQNGQPDDTPSVETYDSLEEVGVVVAQVMATFPIFDPTLFIERVKVASVVDDDGAPCCYGNVTSGGRMHEPGCPSVDQGQRV